MVGDDLTVSLFFLSLAALFGVEVLRAEEKTRRITFGLLAAGCAVAGGFWLLVKKIWPPFTELAGSVATNPIAWFIIVMFSLAVFALRTPKVKSSIASTSTPAPKLPPDQPASDPVIIPPERKEGKIFVDSGPEYLVGLIKNRSRIQAQKLLEPFLGKWIGVRGTVTNIYPDFVSLNGEVPKLFVTMMLNDKNRERFHMLELNKSISVIGKLKDLRQFDVELEECELL